MGTRADFYVGRGEAAEWLGSIAWDGYPDSIEASILTASDERIYRKHVAGFVGIRDDGTKPEQGWPWPWEDSRTTDYAYAFDGDSVWVSTFGHAWFKATDPEPEDESGGKVAVFPDMTTRQNVTLGERSGILIVKPRRNV